MRFNDYDGYTITLRKDQFKELLVEILTEHREPFIAAIKGYVDNLYKEEIEAPLNMKQAADYLGVSRQCLSNWIRKGLVTSRKVGKFQMIEKKELMDAIKQRTYARLPEGRINVKWKGKKSVDDVLAEYERSKSKPIIERPIHDDD